MAKFDISPEVRRTLFWSGIITLVFIVGNLLVWYLFISARQQEVTELNEARGFGSAVPSFQGAGGSMRENVVGFFQSTFETVISGATSTDAAFAPPTPRLWRVNDIPSVGGRHVPPRNATSSGSIWFVDQTSGNVFVRQMVTGSEPVRVTNTLIPYVYEVLWIDNDSLVIRHSEDGGATLRTFVGSVRPGTTSAAVGSLEGGYLEDGVVAVAVNPARKEPALFYILKSQDGVVGILANSDGKNPRRIWTSPLSGWRVSWIEPDLLALTQKASYGVSGSFYLTKPSDTDQLLILRDKNGVAAIRRPGSPPATLYSTSDGGGVKLFSLLESVTREIPISTFVDKCVWGKGREVVAYCAVPSEIPEEAVLPDAWYRGEVHFADRWYKVDPTTGTAEPLIDPQADFGVAIDVIDPSISEQGDTIVFTDAKTGTLWTVRLAI